MKNVSEDDFLSPDSDIFNPDRDEPHLPEDGAPPAAPPKDTNSHILPADDPRTDPASDIDSAELYDEGLASATEADTWDETEQRPKGIKIS